jgi:hypothetical protein
VKTPPTTPKTPPATAHVMGVFAKELEEEGFDDERITALLVVALTSELRQNELMVLDGI